MARDLALDLSSGYLFRDLSNGRQLPDKPARTFATLLLCGLGPAYPRTRLARLTEAAIGTPTALLAAACRASLDGDPHAGALAVALSDYAKVQGANAEPLWPALARRWARCSTDADRALLEDLARHPERREPPLSWGLRFFARGDVWLQDDRVMTLDELCEQVGNPALP